MVDKVEGGPFLTKQLIDLYICASPGIFTMYLIVNSEILIVLMIYRVDFLTSLKRLLSEKVKALSFKSVNVLDMTQQ
jgi:hypothetical protein